MAKIAVHTRTMDKFNTEALELKKKGKGKTSWPRILEESGLSINQLHALFSPVTELPRGFTVIDTNHVKKLEKALGAEPGQLVAILEKGAKDPKSFVKAPEEKPEATA